MFVSVEFIRCPRIVNNNNKMNVQFVIYNCSTTTTATAVNDILNRLTEDSCSVCIHYNL